MPTLSRIDGLRVMIYPHDHPPPHVHVTGRGREAVFLLPGLDNPLVLRENVGFSRMDIRRIRHGLEPEIPALCAAWESIHG